MQMKRTALSMLVFALALACPAQRIGPLIDAPWGQTEPFNGHCPLWDGKYPVEVGCVATALTQVMAYYRHPACTLDTIFGWKTEHLVVDTIMPGAVIDWDNILNDYRGSYTEEEAAAIQDLSLYAATAVHMDFGRNSSGADASHYVRELPRVFGYKTCIECDRNKYTLDGWHRLIINEIENGRPVLYTGHNMDLAGHAFVVDGYDYDTNLFHANWGYFGDFDRWVDLDVMGQFEDPNDKSFWGEREELYCNHYAYLVHPTDEIVPGADTITWHAGDVTVDEIRPLSPTPHTGGYEVIDITFTNHRADTLAYTFEMLSNAPADTALFEQADYVALGRAILMPGETTVFRTSARFTDTGDRILRLSNDDVSLYCPTNVKVEKGKMVQLTFEEPRLLTYKPTEATLAVDIRTSGENRSGALITYCLFPEGSEEDLRHWQIIEANAPDELTDMVTYRNLEPSTTYTLKVRWPWDVRAQYTFTTPKEPSTALDKTTSAEPDGGKAIYYDLSGRRLNSVPRGGVYLKMRR